MTLDQILAGGQFKHLVDWGCLGWKLAGSCAKHGIQLAGVDLVKPAKTPPNAVFFRLNGIRSEVPDAYADITVCSHVIEHFADADILMAELMRITKPGGAIWIEAPSEFAAMRPSSSDPSDHSFQSFWDDPTHVRPWTPGSLYRLALSHRCFPSKIQRSETGGIPVVQMQAIKPLDAPTEPQWRYVTLQNVPPGQQNAWAAIWGAPPDLPSITVHPEGTTVA